LRIEYENDRARSRYNELRTAVTRGLNSPDAEVREEARLLATAMHNVESDELNTWNLKVGGLGPIDGVRTWAAGGARTVSTSSSMTSARTTMFGGQIQGLHPVIALAHELGHVDAIMRRRPPHLAGLPTENAARTLMGCSVQRIYELRKPPPCH
jgi:hypothetical protein